MLVINNMKHEEKSSVNIREVGDGFLIEITDGILNSVFAVTREELKMIVLAAKMMRLN